jgi:hypothetical protein
MQYRIHEAPDGTVIAQVAYDEDRIVDGITIEAAETRVRMYKGNASPLVIARHTFWQQVVEAMRAYPQGVQVSGKAEG